MRYELNGTTLTVHAEAGDKWSGSSEAECEATVQGQKCLQCGWIELNGKQTKLYVRLAGKPDLEKIIAEWKAAQNAEVESRRKAIETGEAKITLTWVRGEPLSGYSVDDDDARVMLEEIGLVQSVEGWGYLFDFKAAESLGEEFTYPQALEFVRPQKEAAEKKKAEKTEKIRQMLAEAKETGRPVAVAKWTEGCDGSADECSTDICTRYAQPDGTFSVERIHCH